jgi:hypothetical protein
MASCTFRRVFSVTFSGLLTHRDTVAIETPASLATSFIDTSGMS